MRKLDFAGDTKQGDYTVFIDPITGERFAISDEALQGLPIGTVEDSLEGVVTWENHINGIMLVCKDGNFAGGAIISPSFEGKRVRVRIEVLGDTDPAPAPSDS